MQLRHPAASPLLLHQREAGVHRAADGGGFGDAVEHIVCLFLPEMMDQQDGDAVGAGQPFQCGQIAVVVGVGCAPDHLKRAKDHPLTYIGHSETVCKLWKIKN